MAETAVITLRVDKRIRNLMRLHDEINWSAVLRKDLERHLEELHNQPVDREKVGRALAHLREAREKGLFSEGKPSVELIREWRQKRR
jgi:hypothetical protein